MGKYNHNFNKVKGKYILWHNQEVSSWQCRSFASCMLDRRSASSVGIFSRHCRSFASCMLDRRSASSVGSAEASLRACSTEGRHLQSEIIVKNILQKRCVVASPRDTYFTGSKLACNVRHSVISRQCRSFASCMLDRRSASSVSSLQSPVFSLQSSVGR